MKDYRVKERENRTEETFRMSQFYLTDSEGSDDEETGDDETLSSFIVDDDYVSFDSRCVTQYKISIYNFYIFFAYNF